MFIVQYKNFFIGLTVLILAGSLFAWGTRGLKLGIDFSGGSVMEVEYAGGRPDVDQVKQQIAATGIAPVIVQTSGDTGFIVRARDLNESERQKLLGSLTVVMGTTTATSTLIASTTPGVAVQTRFDSIGPVIGQELRNKSIYAITLVILLIVLYITFAFRHVSRPIASWKYGMIAVVTLLHDVVVPAGFYSLHGGEVDILFVTAILAILGFSIHDTIVVFDRIRENLRSQSKKETFSETVGKSLSQTFARSINTSLTVVLVLVVLYFVGGGSTRDFALVLIVGIVAGTYSSVFFASPLLVALYDLQEKK